MRRQLAIVVSMMVFASMSQATAGLKTHSFDSAASAASLRVPRARENSHARVEGQAQSPKPVVVDVVAERFSFSPSEIKATAGVPIEFRIKSDDTDHGFRILDTDIDVRIPKRGRGTATVTFTPARAGRYTIECSHVCGAGHSFMRASIVVK